MSAPIEVPYSATPVLPVKQGEKYFVLGPVTGAAAVNISFSPEAPQACTVVLDVVQDGTGSHAVTFSPVSVHGAPSTASDAASSTRLMVIQYDELTESWFYVGGSITTS